MVRMIANFGTYEVSGCELSCESKARSQYPAPSAYWINWLDFAGEGRQPLLATKYKGQFSDGNFLQASDKIQHTDGGGHNFSLDPELLTSLAKGGKNARVFSGFESASPQDVGSFQEKVVCSREKPDSILNPDGYGSPGYTTQVERHLAFTNLRGPGTSKLPHPSELNTRRVTGHFVNPNQ